MFSLKLTADNISKSIKGKTILNHICFEAEDGVYGLIGANGSGKTTLLRILAGIIRPQDGKVSLNNKDIHVMDDEYRAQLGYMPQHLGFNGSDTAEKFLRHMASLKGLHKDHSAAQINKVLESVSLTACKDQKIRTFSEGMKKRLNIAQVLLNDPKILILDEPAAGLDIKERINVKNMLSLIGKNRIVIVATHIVLDVENIAKEILIIKKGELLNKNTPAALLEGMKGKVWRLDALQSAVHRYTEKFMIINTIQKGERVSLRLISEVKPDPNAEPLPPNLEDVYAYYFNKVEALKP